LKPYESKRTAAEQKFYEDSVKYLAQLEEQKKNKPNPNP
jgi:hypothetical protein